MKNIIDKELWIFINTFAPWLSAFGTILAVMVSLYLALRNESIRLRLNIGVRTLFVEGRGPGNRTKYVWLSITNASRRSATITNLYWKFNKYSKIYYVWLAPRNEFSSALPVILNDGQIANYAAKIDDFRATFKEVAIKELKGVKKYWKKYFIKMYVSTSAGQQFSTKIEKGLLEEMFRIADAKDT